MSRRFAPVTGIALLASLAAVLWLHQAGSPERLFEVVGEPVQLSPMCPWRDPDADLKQLFPEASRYEVETRILSGFRPELAQRLGRAPSADENALQVHRVFREADFVGNVMTRRVKGMYGAMELVIAADAQCRIARVLLQRIREPQAIADALQSVSWRERFKGKHAGSHWDSQELLAGLPESARPSAEAVVEGVRSGVVLLDVSGRNLPEHLAQTDSHPH